jgi:hypothetical protein
MQETEGINNPKRNDVNQEVGEELYKLFTKYYLVTRITEDRWAGHVARIGGTRNAYVILVAKPEGIRKRGRPIKMKNKINSSSSSSSSSNNKSFCETALRHSTMKPNH